MTDSDIKIKVKYNNTIKRILNTPNTLVELKEKVQDSFRASKAAEMEEGNFRIAYIDSDDDEIYVSDDEDLNSAKTYAKDRDNKTIKFFIQPKEPQKVDDIQQ